jgi:hypothetical protein
VATSINVALSSEDTFKLNVMLHSGVDAVRIDESRMIVYALSENSESRIELRPNCKAEQYLKQVREILSGHVLGSPGGYPVFLKRWTRMGQARDQHLGDLLKLGEPEAVVAAANAPGLTNDLARRAWWAEPTSDIARRMLAATDVVAGDMGKALAQHLIEHLAFETEPQIMIDTVRLVLQPGLIDAPTRERLWAMGQRRNAYRVGFLQAVPDALPEATAARADLVEHEPVLARLARGGNVLAGALLKAMAGSGQGFIHHTEAVLRKPANQDVVVILLNTIGAYFGAARRHESGTHDIDTVIGETAALCAAAERDAADTELTELLQTAPQLRAEIESLLVLARASDLWVTPIFARTTADGTLMRSKIEPVTTPIFARMAALRGRH